MKNLEDKLQHKIIMAFGQKHPLFRDCLVEMNNDTFSKNHAMKRRSMGMVAGASDLFLFHPTNTQTLFIELKAKGTEHETIRIKNQLKFGESRQKAGHIFILDFDFDRIVDMIDSFIAGHEDLYFYIQENKSYIDEKIKTQFHKKTVTID